MKRPNFFIVGAPKCGTTALSEYLRGHENIFMSNPKEPHYFSQGSPPVRGSINSLKDYLCLFRDAKPHHKVIGEASVWYLYSPSAIQNIKNFDPNAKIIVMLRNPVDLAYSLYFQFLINFEEDKKSFQDAWYAQKGRSLGQDIPKTCSGWEKLMYQPVCSLGEQIENLFRIFPQNQVKVILFDDFKSDTKKVYEEVLAFLGVPSDGRNYFPIINPNAKYRSSRVALLTNNAPDTLRFPVVKLKKLLGTKLSSKLIDSPLHLIRTLNKQNQRPPPLNFEFRCYLISIFKNDIQKLESLIGRSLSSWYT